jgi:hypothetical protein
VKEFVPVCTLLHMALEKVGKSQIVGLLTQSEKRREVAESFKVAPFFSTRHCPTYACLHGTGITVVIQLPRPPPSPCAKFIWRPYLTFIKVDGHHSLADKPT